MSSLSGTTLGRFQILDLIGRGGMGEVYRARDESLGRSLAIKVLPAELTRDARRVERFIQEARAASALNHPHLISIYEIGTAPVHFIAMELVDGRTLRALLESGRLERKRAVDWLLQVCDALGAAHEAGVVHRDIKPENVMIANDRYAKVLDFGIAKLKGDAMVSAEDVTRDALTEAGTMLGTSGYTSPEQARGLPTDHRTDVFSFGCVVYECITGVRAFDAPSALERAHRAINDEAPALTTRAPDAPKDLERIVRKCLAKDPGERYQSMKDLGVDLRDVRRQLDGAPTAVAPEAGRRQRGVMWAAGTAVAAAIVFIGVRLYDGTANREPLTSAARPIGIERLTSTGNTIDASLSPDGRYLAHIEAIGQEQTMWVRDLQSGQEKQIREPDDLSYFGIQFAPDNATIYYTSRGKGVANGRLFAIGREGGPSRALASGVVTPVTFSPDGRQMAFLREQYPDQDSSALMIADAGGGNERLLASRRAPELLVPAFFTSAAWSPNGDVIVASTRNRAIGRARLTAFDVRTGAEHELYSANDDITFAHWLPDASGVVFVSRAFVNFAGIAGQVWLQPYPKGTPRRLTNDVLDYRKVSVSSDGKSIAAVGQESETRLYEVPLDGTRPRRLPSERYDGLQGIARLPDGSLIVTTVISGDSQILRLSSDGRQRTMLTKEGANTFPAVSPDGQQVAMVSTRDGRMGVWIMNVDGSRQRLLAHIPSATWLSFTPDGQHLISTSLTLAVPSTWKIPVGGGVPVEIARQLSRAVVSPDGKWLGGQYVPPGNAENTTSYAAIVPIDGSAPPRLLAPLSFATGAGVVTWAADGSGLILSTRERFNLWFYGVNGDAPRRLTDLTDEEFTRGVLSADGHSVIASRGTLHRDVFVITEFK